MAEVLLLLMCCARYMACLGFRVWAYLDVLCQVRGASRVVEPSGQHVNKADGQLKVTRQLQTGEWENDGDGV